MASLTVQARLGELLVEMLLRSDRPRPKAEGLTPLSDLDVIVVLGAVVGRTEWTSLPVELNPEAVGCPGEVAVHR
jgi:hypothetical protein